MLISDTCGYILICGGGFFKKSVLFCHSLIYVVVETHLFSQTATVVLMLFGRRAIKCTREKKEDGKRNPSKGKVKVGHTPPKESVIIL